MVIFLGQSEAPLMIAPLLPKISRQQLFALMTGGFAAAAGSTLVGYSLLGAPLPYLLAASVMNAPASLLMAKTMSPTRDQKGPTSTPARSGTRSRPTSSTRSAAARWPARRSPSPSARC